MTYYVRLGARDEVLGLYRMWDAHFGDRLDRATLEWVDRPMLATAVQWDGAFERVSDETAARVEADIRAGRPATLEPVS